MSRNVNDTLSVRHHTRYVQPRHLSPTSYGVKASPHSSSISLLSRFKGEYYRCPKCKHVTLKSDVKVSGYDSEHSQRHVHCPKCGKIIAWAPEGGNLRDVIKGAGLTAAGGALSYLLFPFLNIYALQLGFFISLYGTLKVLFRPGI